VTAVFLQQVINGLIIGCIYALMAVGLTMIFGLMDVVNFAHGEFYMLGAFLAYSFGIFLNLNYALSLLLGVIAVFGLGAFCDRWLLSNLRKSRSISMAAPMLLTIAVSEFLKNVILLLYGPIPKRISHPFSRVPIQLGPISLTPIRMFVIIVTVGVIIFFHIFIQKTTIGKAMRATFQDKEAAILSGIEVENIYTFTFGIGCGLAAIGGVLLGSIFLAYPAMGERTVLKSFVVVIMAGMGNFPGAVFSGLILGVAESLGSGFISSGYKDVFGFIIVILILLFKPSGLFGERKV